MSRKDENIFKRKDGRREAKEKGARCKAALLSGTPLPVSGGRRRFGFFCEEWLRLERGKVKESTYVKYDTVLRKHILPKLGGCLPPDITTRRVERFKQELLDGGLAAKTVRDILTVLHTILKYAAAEGQTLRPELNKAIVFYKENEGL